MRTENFIIMNNTHIHSMSEQDKVIALLEYGYSLEAVYTFDKFFKESEGKFRDKAISLENILYINSFVGEKIIIELIYKKHKILGSVTISESFVPCGGKNLPISYLETEEGIKIQVGNSSINALREDGILSYDRSDLCFLKYAKSDWDKLMKLNGINPFFKIIELNDK